MHFDDYTTMEFGRAEAITTVTLNRPDHRNSVDDAMHSELTTLFPDLQRDQQTSVVVLTGAGEAFCAGGDSSPDRTFTPLTGLTAIEEAALIIRGLVDLDKPIIAAVNGDALGLGASLASLCDAAFMVEGAHLGDTHVRGGVTAGNGSAALWPALIGVNRAKALLFGSTLLDADEAAALGLVTRAVPPGTALEAAGELAAQWVAQPAFALRTTKRILNLHLRSAVETALLPGLAWEEQAMSGPEFQEVLRQRRSTTGTPSR